MRFARAEAASAEAASFDAASFDAASAKAASAQAASSEASSDGIAWKAVASDELDIAWEPMAPDEQVPPFVHRGRGWKSLHFSLSAIQSRMRTGRPDALDLEYTRLMMGFLLFARGPRRLAMIGLGGGSLVKFIHRHLPAARLEVVEINRHVVALRDEFDVPPDDERLAVTIADGADFVEQAEAGGFDVLLVDAFDTHGMPAELSTPRFYDACRRLLAPQGVFVVNLQAGDPLCGVHVDRIASAFDGNLLRVDAGDHSNSVVFAGAGRSLAQSRRLSPFAANGAPQREALSRSASTNTDTHSDSADNTLLSSTKTNAAWSALAGDFARIDRALAAEDAA